MTVDMIAELHHFLLVTPINNLLKKFNVHISYRRWTRARPYPRSLALSDWYLAVHKGRHSVYIYHTEQCHGKRPQTLGNQNWRSWQQSEVRQCRIKAGATAIDAAALRPFKKIRPKATDQKSLLYFGCDFSRWYTFEKIIKTVATRCHILMLKCAKFSFGWGSSPGPP